MISPKRFALVLLVVCGLALPGEAVARDSVFTLNLMAGVGGPLDEDDAGLTNQTFQIGFAVEPEDQLLVGLRVGQLDLGNALVGSSIDTTVDYATAVGEYRFTESYYESGLFIGLGAYRLDGVTLLNQSVSEESVGLVLGINGEFLLSRTVSFALEISGHLTNLDTIDTMVMGHAGVAIHF